MCFTSLGVQLTGAISEMVKKIVVFNLNRFFICYRVLVKTENTRELNALNVSGTVSHTSFSLESVTGSNLMLHVLSDVRIYDSNKN